MTQDSAHLTRGTTGEAVAKVQAALIFIDSAIIANGELGSQTYGATTAAAVLAYKTARQIINTAYQQTADEIVGKMTIKSLDDELAAAEGLPNTSNRPSFCRR